VELIKIKLFNTLEEAELAKIKEMANERIYPKGTTVFVSGQKTDGLYVICSGRVKVLMLYPDGREKTLAILREGEILGEVTLYGSELRSATVVTLETTTFLFIAQENFQALLLSIPRLSVRIIELLSRRLRGANRQIEELTFLNARSRVICGLICLAEEHGCEAGRETELLFPLTHNELAQFVGVSRETTTKVLNELRKKALISTNRGRISVPDQAALQRQVF